MTQNPTNATYWKKRAAEAEASTAALRAQLASAVAERDEARKELGRERMAHSNTISQRDAAEDAADGLAYAIADQEVIGEHSNLNNPWANALEQLEIQQTELDAATARADELAARVEALEARMKGMDRIIDECDIGESSELVDAYNALPNALTPAASLAAHDRKVLEEACGRIAQVPGIYAALGAKGVALLEVTILNQDPAGSTAPTSETLDKFDAAMQPYYGDTGAAPEAQKGGE